MVSTNNLHRSEISGGDAIAAGGFGCVFKPPLTCEQANSNTYNPNGVSKLMYTEDAISEINKMNKIHEIIKNIPNYKNYFLLHSYNICKPAPLTGNDLISFNNKCDNFKFKSNGVNSTNINQLRNQLNIINMPYGGNDLDEYWNRLISNKSSGKDKLESFLKTCQELANLAIYAIIPMNQLGLLHLDLKSLNILRNKSIFTTKDVKVTMIDWGLCAIVDNTHTIPRMVTGRPFQFNLPVGIILFYRLNELDNILKKQYGGRTIKNREITKKAVQNYLMYIRSSKPSQPHLDAIYDTTFKYLKFLKKIDSTIVIPVDPVLEIISEIVYHFTCEPCMVNQQNYFDYKRYFFEVILVNADLHGFLTCYINILDIYVNTATTPTQSPTIVKLLFLFKKYCLDSTYAITPINIDIFKKEINDTYSSSKKTYEKDLSFFNMFSTTQSKITKSKKRKQTKKTKQAKTKKTKKTKQTKKIKKRKQTKKIKKRKQTKNV